MMKKLILYIFSVISGLAVSFFLVSRPASLPLEGKISPDYFRISIANINHANRNAVELTESLIQTDFDVLLILEWQGHNLALDTFRKNGYSVSLNQPRPGTHGVCLVSRRELEIQAKLVNSPVNGPCRIPIATARFQYNSRFFTLLGVHIPPPVASCKNTTLPTIKAIQKMIEGGVLRKPFGVGEYGDPLIVAGDFNLYSFHREIERFKDLGLNDTYSETNVAFGPTWAPLTWMPSLLRIDYIFASHELAAISSSTVVLPGSDHRGIVSDVKI